MSGQAEELGRIIRGEIEEIWSLVAEDGGSAAIRLETVRVAGDERSVNYMGFETFYESDAPEPIKNRLRQRGLVPK